MSRQKGLPHFGQKFNSDQIDEAKQLSEEIRSMLGSVYSSQNSCHQLQLKETGDSISTLLGGEAIHYELCHVGSRAIGAWCDDRCILVKQRGAILDHCKNKSRIRLEHKGSSVVLGVLPIEETLFLAERGSLIVFSGKDGSLVPIEILYEYLDKHSSICNGPSDDIPLSHYLVYGTLRRSGMSLVRRQPLSGSKIKDLKSVWDMYRYFNMDTLTNNNQIIPIVDQEISPKTEDNNGVVWKVSKSADDINEDIPIHVADADSSVISFLQKYEVNSSSFLCLIGTSHCVEPLRLKPIPSDYSATSHQFDSDCHRE